MIEKDKYIGIFDSGIGGLTVVKAITELLPNENIIYFGDSEHMPYGNKTDSEIIGYVLDVVRYISQFELKSIVIACNTADSVARKKVVESYDVPVFGVVDPASRMAAETTVNKRVGVIATAATVQSGSYEAAIGKYDQSIEVFTKACPLLATMVEEGRFHKGDIVIETVLNEYLEPLKDKDIDTLILGCTHYPLLIDIIKEIMPDVQIISSSQCAAQSIMQELKDRDLLKETPGNDHRYFVSSDPERFKKLSTIFMGNSGQDIKEVKAK